MLSIAKHLLLSALRFKIVEPTSSSPICSRSAYPKQASSLLSFNRKFRIAQNDTNPTHPYTPFSFIFLSRSISFFTLAYPRRLPNPARQARSSSGRWEHDRSLRSLSISSSRSVLI